MIVVRLACLALGLAVVFPSLSFAWQGSAEPGRVPLSFEANRGQAGGSAQFLARGRGYSVVLDGAGATLTLNRYRGRRAIDEPDRLAAVERTRLRMSVVGANSAPPVAGLRELPGKVNYLVGNDPSRWRVGIPTYSQVRYRNVYQGVDLVYYGNERQLEYDFVVAPGADPGVITLAFDGADALRVTAEGDLVLLTGAGELRFRKPTIYQEAGGERRAVAGGYVLKGERRVGFRVADYDRTKALTIDPVLVYSTYLGGSEEDNGSAIAVDATGIYIAGLTVSLDFPTGGFPYQDAKAADYDAFVTKLNPAGTVVIYSTYLGGNSTDYGFGLAVDAAGNAYVTGSTASTDFPTTTSAYQGTSGGGFDAFLTKLDASGSGLLYSTYLGGGNDDFAFGVALDASGNAYVTGRTSSTNFPVAGTPLQDTNGGGTDAFVAKLNPSASGAASLVYATYLGGSGDDGANGVVVDASGNATVTGRTSSTNFPMVGTPFQSTNGGDYDVIVATLDPGGSTLLYSTYLGGSGEDRGLGIARDTGGNVYITGRTLSTNFPTTPGAFDTTCGSDGTCNFGKFDAFVAKLNPAAAGAASLVYATYLGGGRVEEGRSIAVDGAGNAHVTGYTDSTDFPTANALQPVCGMGCGTGLGPVFVDVFVAKLNATGSALTFSTYLGGSSADYGIAIYVDASGAIYLTGEVFSDNFPTVDPVSGTWSGHYDVFVAKIENAATSADLGVDATASPDPATVGTPWTYTLTVTNVGPDAATGVRLVARMPAGNLTVNSTAPSQGTCALVFDSFSFSHEVRCDLNSLAAAAAATVTVNATPTSEGTITSTAAVASRVSDPAGANNAVTRDTPVVLPPPPSITSFTPASGAVGASVTITGTSLGTASSVTFNGTFAGFTVDSDVQITATVPSGATTGPIGVTTVSGTATSASNFTVGTLPTITTFTPASGAVGAHVTVNGTGFTGATSVTFNGTAAAFTITSPTRITTSVPAGATTGPIGVTTPGGTATSANNFVVAPRITGFTPPNGPPGASVVIAGANFSNATAVKFNGTAATFHVDSSVQITATVPASATTGAISVTASPGGTATSSTSFVVAPRITTFTPTSGVVGASVTINGANFTGATSVTFNGTSASFTVSTATRITATVPSGATSGSIAVTTPAGTGTSATSFTVNVAPRITSFTPTSGVVGASVTINGANFTGATSVKFNGTSASFTVNTAIKITATVPAGATKGKIDVATPAGTATSSGTFTVKPSIANFTPGNGAVGAAVTINGAAFTGATSVKFNGLAATFHVDSSARITATVPVNATSGPVTVTTPGGTATSATSFTVAPRITSFTPVNGPGGTSVGIRGANFTGATSVKFNGTAAGYVVNSSIKITATVPTGASTGKISVTTPAGTATSTGNFAIP